MIARASGMRTVTMAGERWVSVADMVIMLRDMATDLGMTAACQRHGCHRPATTRGRCEPDYRRRTP